jgi:hypothetical protein
MSTRLKFEESADAAGFDFWYDRELRQWTLAKEGYETAYINPWQFKELDLKWLVNNYITNATKYVRQYGVSGKNK